MKLAHQATRLANNFRELPRTENDLEVATVLVELAKVYEAAFDMVYADTHEQSKKAYVDMINLVKGTKNGNS